MVKEYSLALVGIFFHNASMLDERKRKWRLTNSRKHALSFNMQFARKAVTFSGPRSGLYSKPSFCNVYEAVTVLWSRLLDCARQFFFCARMFC